MRQDLTHIIVALDASGSMASIRQPTITGLNAFIEAQKKLPGEAIITVVAFDSVSTPINSPAPASPGVFARRSPQIVGHKKGVRMIKLADRLNIQAFAGLSNDNYRPDGGTPLYHTQSVLIDQTGEYLASLPEDERPGKVMFVTVTDGGDTDERDFPEHDLGVVKRKIEHQQNVYSWDFSYIGANQDAEQTAAGMGMLRGKALTYGATQQGTTAAFSSMSSYVGNVRGCSLQGLDTTAVSYTEADKQAQASSGSLQA